MKNQNFSKICLEKSKFLWNCLKKSILISRKFARKNRNFVDPNPRPPRFQTRLTPLLWAIERSDLNRATTIGIERDATLPRATLWNPSRVCVFVRDAHVFQQGCYSDHLLLLVCLASRARGVSVGKEGWREGSSMHCSWMPDENNFPAPYAWLSGIHHVQQLGKHTNHEKGIAAFCGWGVIDWRPNGAHGHDLEGFYAPKRVRSSESGKQ